MIKVEVTHLKAPWPAGAVVGAVVSLLGAVKLPAWAVGKCVVLGADDEREPVAVWAPPQIDHSDPQARTFVVNPAAVADQLQQNAARIAELEQQLADADQALGTARAEIGSLGAQLAAALADAQKAKEAATSAEAYLLEAAQHRDDAVAARDKAVADLAAATAPKAAKKAAAT